MRARNLCLGRPPERVSFPLALPAITQQFLGGLFALGSAACWAAASILWARLGRDVSPLAMNLGKGLVGVALLAITLMAAGFNPVEAHGWLLLGISGICGVAFGDTLYFLSLVRLGPRRALLLTTLIPVVAVFLAIVILGERLSASRWIGAALCIGGIAWVMMERLPKNHDHGSWKKGVWYGLVSVIFCATAVIFSKKGLDHIPALDASFIRLLCGSAGLFAYLSAKGTLKSEMSPFKSTRLVLILLLAAFIGTYVGIWLSLLALRHCTASVATILNATSPVFVLPLSAMILKEKISARSIAGALAAVAGAAWLLLG